MLLRKNQLLRFFTHPINPSVAQGALRFVAAPSRQRRGARQCHPQNEGQGHRTLRRGPRHLQVLSACQHHAKFRRYFFGLRPIAVSPIGVKKFVGEWAARVLRSEVQWVLLPCLLVLLGQAVRRRFRGPAVA